MIRDTALARLIRAATQALPDLDDAWGDAIGAELQAIPTLRERASFTASSLRGLAAIAFARRLRCWQSNSSTLLIVAALGVITAAVDLRADSRWPLRLAVPLSCAAVGWLAPRVARLGGVLVGLALPLAVTVSGYRGPYEVDRGDVWFPVLPALMIAASFGWLRTRLLSRRTP